MQNKNEPTFNEALLLKVRDALTPDNFDMDDWCCIEGRVEISLEHLKRAIPKMHTCGTTLCIAGYAVALGGMHSEFRDIDLAAKSVLGLDVKQYKRLFYVRYWPEPFKADYIDAKHSKDTITQVRVGRARIDHFILTGGAE